LPFALEEDLLRSILRLLQEQRYFLEKYFSRLFQRSQCSCGLIFGDQVRGLAASASCSIKDLEERVSDGTWFATSYAYYVVHASIQAVALLNAL